MTKTILSTLLCLIYSVNSFTQDQTVKGNLILRGDDDTTPYKTHGKRLYFGSPNDNTDPIWIARYNTSQFYSELRMNIGDDWGDKFCVGFFHFEGKPWKNIFLVSTAGKVGINTDNPISELDVNGTIRSKEVKIEATDWPDFGFDKDYKLPTLQAVEQHINDKGHLPDIPSQKEVVENGVNVVEMQAKLLQKIEELTLYTIQLEKRINEIENK